MRWPDACGGDEDNGQVASVGLLVSCGDPAEVFVLSKKGATRLRWRQAFPADAALNLAIPLDGDVRLGAVPADEVEDGLRIAAAISRGMARCRQPRSMPAIASLSEA